MANESSPSDQPRHQGMPRHKAIGRRSLFGASAALAATALTGGVAAANPRTVPVGKRPSAIALSEAGTAYVTNKDDSTVSILRDGSVIGRAPVIGPPTDVAIDDVLGKAFVVGAGKLTVLHTDTNRVGAIIEVAPGSSVLTVDHRTHAVYVGSGTDGAITIVDGAAETSVAQLPGAGSGFAGAAADAARGMVYFAGVSTAAVAVFDPSNRSVVASIPVGTNPTGLAMHESSNTLYVANAGIHHLSIVDCGARQQRAKVVLRSAASAVAVHTATNAVYANGGPNGLVKVVGEAIASELPLGINPGAVAVHQRTNDIYVADPVHNAVQVTPDF